LLCTPYLVPPLSARGVDFVLPTAHPLGVYVAALSLRGISATRMALLLGWHHFFLLITASAAAVCA